MTAIVTTMSRLLGSYNYNCMIWLSQCFHDCNCNYNVKAFDVFHIAISLAAEFVYNDMDL